MLERERERDGGGGGGVLRWGGAVLSLFALSGTDRKEPTTFDTGT